MTDIQLVRRCLQRWLSIARSFRYAGMGDKLKLTEEALEALERIAAPRFDWTPREEKAEWTGPKQS